MNLLFYRNCLKQIKQLYDRRVAQSLEMIIKETIRKGHPVKQEQLTSLLDFLHQFIKKTNEIQLKNGKYQHSYSSEKQSLIKKNLKEYFKVPICYYPSEENEISTFAAILHQYILLQEQKEILMIKMPDIDIKNVNRKQLAAIQKLVSQSIQDEFNQIKIQNISIHFPWRNL